MLAQSCGRDDVELCEPCGRKKKVIEKIALSKSCFNVGFVPW